MTVCPTCGQPIPQAAVYISERELEILSAWWLLHSTRAVANFFTLSEQTVKNQLYKARKRNGVTTSTALAQMWMGRLISMSTLTAQRNQRSLEVA